MMALLALFGAGAGARGEDAPELIAPADAAVSKAVVTRGAIAKMQPYQATVVPAITPLAFTVSGVVGQMHVVPGQAVKKGDVLVTLDCEDIAKSIVELEGEIEFAKSLYDYQTRIAQIDSQLMALELAQLTEPNEILLKQNDIAVLRTQADEAYETYQLEQQNREYTLNELREKTQGVELIAPIDGVVAAMKPLTPGTNVLAKQNVLWLADETQLYVQCEFQQQQKMDTAVSVYALIGGMEYPCTYIPMEDREYVAQTLMGGTMRSNFMLSMSTLPKSVHSGLSAAVCVITQQKQDVLLVPSSAVYRSGGSRFVYVIGEDGSMSLRDVTTGIVTDLVTEIVSGVKEGEQIYVKE